MERSFSLIKNEFGHHEKKILPRFPFCYLVFKSNGDSPVRFFEIKDISLSGMQLALKDGEHNLKENDQIEGFIHWHGKELSAEGRVKWTTDKRLGLAFAGGEQFNNKIETFLSPAQIATNLRTVDASKLQLETPANLRYWLSADGPMEFFVWQHSDGEISRFQILLMEKYIEWEDGQGLRTGRVLSKRDVDTPLLTEDEFVFQIDENVSEEKINFALQVIDHLKEDLISDDVIAFFKRKMGK
ncbi:MAG: PilZ domain-containing protein [Bacteriovoracia bacterium]